MNQSTCSIDGCDRPRRARQMCNLHYQRYREGRDLNAPAQVKLSGVPSERFWPRVDRDTPGGCWLWTGGTNSTGYGWFAVGRGRNALAHRYAWEQIKGVQLHPEQLLDHMCHVTRCVNPAHLRLSDYKRNNENRKGLSRNNTTGHSGVYLDKRSGKWYAQVTHNGQAIYGGQFNSPAAAGLAARNLRNELFTDNSRDR